ncbi:uncharacterized protein SCHCODRAFT_02553880 [Schizophyllum commune H4-8]|nr:uncharacterized protein SCHCODRAFT_02553880 [Schizophyllum commune H4-8]KAI5886818.1 hypothetical protein SCHCODRAFT_02553880 [Schizophyllum commune H4-8]
MVAIAEGHVYAPVKVPQIRSPTPPLHPPPLPMDTAEEETQPPILSFPFGRVPDEWEVHTIPSGVDLRSSSHGNPEDALEDSHAVQDTVLYKIEHEDAPFQIKTEDSPEERSLKASTYYYNRAARIITTDDIRQADVRARVRQACGGLGGLLSPPPPLPKRSPTVARPPIRGRARASTTLARASSPYERVASSSTCPRSSSYTGLLAGASSMSTDRTPSPMTVPGAEDGLISRASSGSVSVASGSSNPLTDPRSLSRKSDCDKIVKEGQVQRVCWWEEKEVKNVQLNEDGEPVSLIPDLQSEFWKTLAEFPCHRPLPAMAEHELMRAYEEDKNVRALFEFVPEHQEMFDELTALRATTYQDISQQRRRDKIIAHHVAVLMEAACFLRMRQSALPFSKMSIRHPTRRLAVEELLERAASVANLAMLRTHSEPTPVQIAAINEYTLLLESELKFLPQNDNATRERILAQLDIHRSIFAPIRRLPTELLIEIFSLLAYESSLRTLQIASTIARVCAVWRDIAHGLTKFWTKLVVKSLSDIKRYCQLFLPLTKGKLPDLRCDNPKILGSLWDGIEPYASTWRSLSIEGRLSMIPDLKVLYMENLERLVVDAYDKPESPELSVLDFVVAPRLRHIALTLDVLQSERQLHVPVTRALTSLEIEVMSPFPITHTLPLLRACAGTLETLTLKVRHPLEGSEGSYPTSVSDTFAMNALTLLSLIDPACALLNHITAPHIEELALGNVPAYGTRSLMGFLTRDETSRHLIALRVYKVEERDIHAWIPCLQLMDKLRDLFFDELLSNRRFLEQLIRYEDRPPLLPSLKNIAIWDIFRKHRDLHDIIGEMCASRAKFTVVNGRRRLETISWINEWG